MTIEEYRDEIKEKLTGNILELEIDDALIDKTINSSLREVQRYIDSTKIITIPYQRCINMTKYRVSAITNVYRAVGYGDVNGLTNEPTDPMLLAQWQILFGAGNIYNFNNAVYNYASWNTALQLRNTTSTDLVYYYDKPTNMLYINTFSDNPPVITIEYIPKYVDVAEVTSDFWVDILLRLSLANVKIILGRIRSRYTQTNTLWQQDGATMLEEGKAELNELREQLRASNQISLPVD